MGVWDGIMREDRIKRKEGIEKDIQRAKANEPVCRLGIELAKTMSLNYSNQETSVTVGESVRDEDGTFLVFRSVHLNLDFNWSPVVKMHKS